jgi:hypothetical protein
MPSNRLHLHLYCWRFAPVVQVISRSINPAANYRLSGGISEGQIDLLNLRMLSAAIGGRGGIQRHQVDSVIPLSVILVASAITGRVAAPVAQAAPVGRPQRQRIAGR